MPGICLRLPFDLLQIEPVAYRLHASHQILYRHGAVMLAHFHGRMADDALDDAGVNLHVEQERYDGIAAFMPVPVLVVGDARPAHEVAETGPVIKRGYRESFARPEYQVVRVRDDALRGFQDGAQLGDYRHDLASR